MKGGWLRVGAWLACALGASAAVLPGDAGTVAGVAALTAVVGIPLVRVAALARQWVLEGDDRFAGLAVALLGVVAAGAVLALAA